MTTFKVLVSDPLGPAGIDRLLAERDIEVVDASAGDREHVLSHLVDADALIVRSGTQVDAELFAAAPRLRVVGRAGVGVDNVDLDAATRRGVIVVNTPRANTVATAEQTFALLLAASRRTAAAHRSLGEGNWERKAFTGIDLAGRTLGIVGFGRIGREVAARARAFGMEVIAFDPYVSEVIGRDHAVALVDFADLLAASDVISLHAIPPADGSALLGEREIAAMKPGAIVVNAARGQLLDADAARRALDSGHLRGVAIDVYDVEPPPSDHPLLNHPAVVHTPHLGASTEEAQRDVSLQVVDEVLAGLRGETMTSCVNVPFVFDAETEAQLGLARAMGRVQRAMAPGPIERVDVEVSDDREELLPVLAAGVLAGILEDAGADQVNFVNAPALATEHGIKIRQGRGLGTRDYPNLMSCRVGWSDGDRVVSGVVFGGKEPRIVQVSDYQLDAKPEGVVLLMLNEDLPGVVGEVGTLLGDHGVNIAEWRLGRSDETGLALSFINLDAVTDEEALQALRSVGAVRKAEIVDLG